MLDARRPTIGSIDPASIEAWVFDLDNTLYPAECDLFAQIDQRMGQFIQERLNLDPITARTVQKRYFFDHGTTLAGLMARHAIDPSDFLGFVHDIDVAPVVPNPRLHRALDALPGRKLIFTNGSAAHAARVLERLGIATHFDVIFDIVAAAFVPKPQDAPYDALMKAHGVRPGHSVMVEDMARNLIPAAARGISTVWLNTRAHHGHLDADAGAIDTEISDLTGWLESMA